MRRRHKRDRGGGEGGREGDPHYNWGLYCAIPRVGARRIIPVLAVLSLSDNFRLGGWFHD